MTIKEMIAMTGEEYMLRQLAEECAELAQAALKLVRAWNGETPVPASEARAALIEELADASLMQLIVEVGLLTLDEDVQRQEIFHSKRERFIRRLQAKQTPAD